MMYVPSSILSWIQQETIDAKDASSLAIRIEKEKLFPTLQALQSGGWDYLIDLFAIDYLAPTPHTDLLYFLHHPASSTRMYVLVSLPRFGSIPTITPLWLGANWYEREIYDLFGIHFEGHPHLTRILMPDDWIGHPLLRDYPLTEEPVTFLNGARPQIPSDILNHVSTPFST